MANETPESEFSIECFQNYSAPEVFVQGLAGIVDQNDVEVLIRAQKTMLQRFEKTTEMLTNCNSLSANRFKVAGVEFRKHTQLLLEMKKDLEYIFKKIRTIKGKLSTQYPEAYKRAEEMSASTRRNLDEEDEDEFTEPGTSFQNLHRQSGMVSTVSTETLKPNTQTPNFDRKDSQESGENPRLDSKCNNSDVEFSSDLVFAKVRNFSREEMENKRNSSSSETGSQDSASDTTSDTG